MKLIEIICGLLILMAITPKLFEVWHNGHLETQKRLAADHLALVNRAGAGYVRKHQTTLLTQATPNSGPVISVADLVNDGLLPDGVRDRNVWGQSYRLYIRQPQPKNLQAVVLTAGGRSHDAGSKFGTATVPGAATLLGGPGGFVPTGDIPGQAAGTLHGAGGGWVVSLGGLGIPSPGAGHLGALSTFDPSSLGQDQLYRVAVPGHPELNQMQTELDMTDHAIRGVSELQFTEREITTEACTTPEEQGRVFLDRIQGLYLCRNNGLEVIGDTGNSAQLREAAVAKNGDRITKPVCAPATNTAPAIFTSPSIAEAGPEAPPLTSFQTWATSLSDTQWQVHMRVQTSSKTLDGADSDGWVHPKDNYNRIMVFTTCAKAVTP